jgi:hypothetical protein
MLHESWLDKLRQPGAEPAERDNANALDKPSMLDKLHGAVAEQAARNADPYLRILTPVLPTDGTMISTNLIANYLGIKPTSGSGRRIARTMRSLGYFPLKSRTLLPGGWRGSEGRGWVRPIRQNRDVVDLQALRLLNPLSLLLPLPSSRQRKNNVSPPDEINREY